MASGDASTVSTTYRSVACQGVNFWVPERYRNIVGVGSGSYGSVCKAIDGRDAEEVAIKRIGWTHKSVVGKDYWIKVCVAMSVPIDTFPPHTASQRDPFDGAF